MLEDPELAVVLVSEPRAVIEKTTEEAEAELAESLKEEGAEAPAEEGKEKEKEKKD